MQVSFEFVPVGVALDAVPCKVAVDVGSRFIAGVIDHHCRGIERECAASLVQMHPDFVLRHVGQDAESVTIVMHRDPDLDCVTAAWFVQSLLESGNLPEHASKIAAYVRDIDAGLPPPDGIRSGSIWAMYAAATSIIDEQDLADHDRFTRHVQRGLELLDLVNACGGVAPVTGPDLARWKGELSILEDDEDRYRSDVRRARKLAIALPTADGLTRRVRGLELESPQSALFKHYARADGYQFLYIVWESNHSPARHMLSVAPESGLSLLGLGATLEKHEELERLQRKLPRPAPPRWPDVTNADPWYDGRSPLHGYSIVESPRQGTILSRKQIRRIVADSERWIAIGASQHVRICSDGHTFQGPEGGSAVFCPHDGTAVLPAVVDGRYRIVRSLGHGGMGSVSEVEDLLTGHKLALKIILREKLGDSLLWERFACEARILEKLKHESVVRFCGFGADQSRGLYLVSELVPGLNLKEELGHWKSCGREMPLHRVMQVGLGISEALAYLHRRQILHRDLKPANIKLPNVAQPGQEQPRVKLLDFGLAISLDPDFIRLTRKGVVATPLYASPEQLRRKPVDSRSDLYSLGTVLYELLCGTPPFADCATFADLTMSKGLSVPPSIGDLRPEVDGTRLQKLVDALVHPAVAQRPQSAELVRRVLVEALKSPAQPGTPARPAPTRQSP